MKNFTAAVTRMRASRLSWHRQRGSALAEYTLVVLFLVIVLIADPNVIRRTVDALRGAYASFVYALSVSWV